MVEFPAWSRMPFLLGQETNWNSGPNTLNFPYLSFTMKLGSPGEIIFCMSWRWISLWMRIEATRSWELMYKDVDWNQLFICMCIYIYICLFINVCNMHLMINDVLFTYGLSFTDMLICVYFLCLFTHVYIYIYMIIYVFMCLFIYVWNIYVDMQLRRARPFFIWATFSSLMSCQVERSWNPGDLRNATATTDLVVTWLGISDVRPIFGPKNLGLMGRQHDKHSWGFRVQTCWGYSSS